MKSANESSKTLFYIYIQTQIIQNPFKKEPFKNCIPQPSNPFPARPTTFVKYMCDFNFSQSDILHST